MILGELTIPFDRVSNIEAARVRKHARYEYLAADIEPNGYTCSNSPIEVGVRGYIIPRNRNTLMFLTHTCKVRKPKEMIKIVSKLALGHTGYGWPDPVRIGPEKPFRTLNLCQQKLI